jgi:hypothetical protein
MSRFPGWTNAAIKDLQKINYKAPKVKDYITPIVTALRILGIHPVTEYRFLHDRRFRFDIAIPENKIAIEFEGGIFKRGRHTRGKGYSNDCKKYNLAVMHGWKLLRYTPDRTQTVNWEFQIADEVRELIEGTK